MPFHTKSQKELLKYGTVRAFLLKFASFEGRLINNWGTFQS